MDKTAIEKIMQAAEPHVIEHDGYTYSDKELLIIKKPAVRDIYLRTLSSLVELLKIEIDLFDGPVITRVVSPTKVEVLSAIDGADRSRECPYIVEAETVDFNFGRWYSYESMMIALKSKFVETPELNEVVKLLGTITEENNTKIADDGFTQTVTVRKGIALKDNKAINPRVKLVPYCTFNEIPQPEREFLLRLNGSGEVALFEADGGAWKIEVRRNIAKYLRENFRENSKVCVVE